MKVSDRLLVWPQTVGTVLSGLEKVGRIRRIGSEERPLKAKREPI
ncbi:MAG: hypothetical protein ACE5Z5_02505 [Candidatus Bathyarchaeia archaeon]